MLLKIGCSGFAVARERYFSVLTAVETDGVHAPARAQTAELWREEAPSAFDFSVRAWKVITHPDAAASSGHFKPTPAVAQAWVKTRAVALALHAKFILFDTPASFYPDADHLRNMYRFFKEIPRTGFACVWQPRGAWSEAVIGRVCADLQLLRAVNPLESSAISSNAHVNYFRVSPPRLAALHTGKGSLGAEDFQRILKACANSSSHYYVFFAYPCAWHDACQFSTLAQQR